MHRCLMQTVFILILVAASTQQQYYYGWFNDVLCDPSCYYCYYGDDPTYCYQCDSSWNRYTHSYILAVACPCNSGYYEAGLNTCPRCSYQCTTCSSSATNCDTCSSLRTTTPTCNCIAGYYDNGSGSYSSSCSLCQYTCVTCSSSTSCITCDSTKKRFLTSSSAYCLCADRFYDNGVALCVSCNPTCYRCSGPNSNQCTVCNSVAYRTLSSSTCVCQTGYYQTSTSVEQCSPCLYSCLTCSGLSTTCTSCSSALNRVLTSNTCPCSPGYFQNSSLLCQACLSGCGTCSDSQSCLTCISGQNMIVDSSGFCSCASGKYWTGSTCTACSYKCLTCIGSSTNCSGCAVGSNRIFFTGSCNCKTGYYDNSVTICLACYYACSTCTNGLNTGCSTCDSSKMRTISSGKCVCNAGYYDDGSNVTCRQCNYKCATCSVSTSCLTCNSSLFRTYNSTTMLCQCLSKYYQNNFLCSACISTCLTCTNGVTCTSCDPALNRSLNTTSYLCGCMTGYYLNGSNLCAPCNSLCASCVSADTCTSCQPNSNRTLNSNTSTCICSTGYILISSSNQCLSCQYNCLTCSTNFTNKCATCDPNAFRTINSSNSQCPCNVGYYDNGLNATCLLCSYTCYTCLNSAFTCTSCLGGSFRVYSSTGNTCLCSQHYYDNIVNFAQNASCFPCLYVCSTCSKGDSCTSCNATNYRIFDSMNAICICKNGYYDAGNQLCLACNYGCSTCTNSTSCLTCNSLYSRNLPSSLCPCALGYYDSGISNCNACQYSCLTCNISTVCLTCQSAYFRVLNSSSKLCSCMGRYYDAGVQTCFACSYSCLTCSGNGSHCLSCNTTAKRTYSSASFSCNCNSGYYDNAIELCSRCIYSCQTCTNFQSCTTCNLTNKRAINSLTGTCICTTGYYDNNVTQPCIACQSTCLTCINSTNCISCDSNRFRAYNTTKDYANYSNPFCPCIYKYYSLGSNNSCSPCHFSCAYCSGPLISNCLYCSESSNRVLKSNGKCTCNTSYYDTNTTQICPLCNIACASCWNDLTTTCFTCNISYFTMVGAFTCYQTCPVYYFNNLTAMICTSCQIHCLYCYNATNCTECQAPMFLLNSTCINICPKGLYANTTTHSCELCKIGCANCTASNNCFQCVNTSYYVDQATTLCELCNEKCLTCFGPFDSNCLNCTYPLFLSSGHMCTNLTCAYGKYIDTFKGCVSCSQLYPHSIACNLTEAFLCSNTYQLKAGVCVGCASVLGYALNSYGQCSEICGDGIRIYYQCDDGNNRNGDGCSANCLIENGWTCLNPTSKSVCTLIKPPKITLSQVIKFSGLNKVRLIMSISLPFYLANSNFQLTIPNLQSNEYSYNILKQDFFNLNTVSIDIYYSVSIQQKAVTLAYQQNNRLLMDQQPDFRLLSTVNFQESYNIESFPPANYITQSTMDFYSTAQQVIVYLSIILVVMNLVIIPKKYGLHSVSLSWIVPYFYFTYYYSTSYSTQFISPSVSNLQYQSFLFGFSLGDCCVQDQIIGTTSQIFSKIGLLLILNVAIWGIYLVVQLVSMFWQIQTVEQILNILKYYILTFHLITFLQYSHSSLTALYNYQLNNRIDAVNITFSLFVLIGNVFFVCSLWYITKISKFQGSNDGLSSKAATRHTLDRQSSDKSEENNYNNIINLSQVKEMSKYEITEFNKSSSVFNRSTMFLNKNTSELSNTIISGFKNQSKLSKQVQMGEQQSLFSFDYCFNYKNQNKNSKYYLPLLISKLFLLALFDVLLKVNKFSIMVTNILLNLIILWFLIANRPFNSKFTNFRAILIEIVVFLTNCIYAVYQFYAGQLIYVQSLQLCVIIGIIVTLGSAIIFSLIEHYKIWLHKMFIICQPCILFFKLKGKKNTIYDRQQQSKRKIIQVQTINQSQIMETDAFYVRVLQKQALNRQYKRQRMIRDAAFQKSFA